MKKLMFALLLAMFALSGVSYAYDQPGSPGSKLKNVSGGSQASAIRVYQLVRHGLRGDSTAQIASGASVRWDSNSDDGVTVGVSTVSVDGAFAGIAVTAIPTADAGATSAADDIGRRNWGFVQVYGPATATVTAGGTNGNAVGDVFVTSDDDGVITTIMNINGAGALSNDEAAKLASAGGGFFLDAADTSSTSVDVFIQTQ